MSKGYQTLNDIKSKPGNHVTAIIEARHLSSSLKETVDDIKYAFDDNLIDIIKEGIENSPNNMYILRRSNNEDDFCLFKFNNIYELEYAQETFERIFFKHFDNHTLCFEIDRYTNSIKYISIKYHKNTYGCCCLL